MNKIKELRKKYKITQKELALALDIPYRTIQRWENGETTINKNKAQLIADYFGVTVPYLLGYDVSEELLDIFNKIDFESIEVDTKKVEKIKEAYENVEKYIDNPEKYLKFGEGLKSVDMGYMLTIQRLIISDCELGTHFADVLINYIALDDYDRQIAFDLIKKLAEKGI